MNVCGCDQAGARMYSAPGAGSTRGGAAYTHRLPSEEDRPHVCILPATYPVTSRPHADADYRRRLCLAAADSGEMITARAVSVPPDHSL